MPTNENTPTDSRSSKAGATSDSEELTVKVVRGERQADADPTTIWSRFDRLQRSLRPLRKNKRLKPGLHYGNQS